VDCGLNIGPGEISMGKIPREDWAESWKKYFKTIEIGSALLIKPTWSKQRPARGQAAMVLDPGLSFGTGQHPTTHFCLDQLVAFRNKEKAQACLDIGTGSGIHAIAAAKVGYHPVRAFDLDPKAVRIAKENVRKNRVQNHVSIIRLDLSRYDPKSRVQYDLICANLVDDLLVGQAQKILGHLKQHGRLVLAGILASQFSAVQKAYENAGLQLMKTLVDQEWQSGSFSYPAAEEAKVESPKS
jgi:ribosomal protein L11 methyltransferase